MTPKQRTALMAEWWPAACLAMNWKVSDRELRLRVLSEAVGRELQSANDLDRLTDIDQVKSHLLALARPDDLDSQVAIQNMPRERLKTAIARVSPGNNYMKTIMRDRWGTENWDDLSLEQLEQLRNTLESRRLSIKRRNKEGRAHSPSEPPPSVAASTHDNEPF